MIANKNAFHGIVPSQVAQGKILKCSRNLRGNPGNLVFQKCGHSVNSKGGTTLSSVHS